MQRHLNRSLGPVLAQHLERHRQMAFVVGPRQVGKTTVCRGFADDSTYLNWADEDDRASITRGVGAVAERVGLGRLGSGTPVVVFDELHKYRRWRTFLKGFFDRHADAARILVTGSSRLDLYRKGGDSLMGRYFVFRMHPLSVGELRDGRLADRLLREPRAPSADAWRRLWEQDRKSVV